MSFNLHNAPRTFFRGSCMGYRTNRISSFIVLEICLAISCTILYGFIMAENWRRKKYLYGKNNTQIQIWNIPKEEELLNFDGSNYDSRFNFSEYFLEIMKSLDLWHCNGPALLSTDNFLTLYITLCYTPKNHTKQNKSYIDNIYFDAEPFMPTNRRFFEGFDHKLFDSGIILCVWFLHLGNIKGWIKSVQITHWGNRPQYPFHTVEWFIVYYITIKSLLLKGSSDEGDIMLELTKKNW